MVMSVLLKTFAAAKILKSDELENYESEEDTSLTSNDSSSSHLSGLTQSITTEVVIEVGKLTGIKVVPDTNIVQRKRSWKKQTINLTSVTRIEEESTFPS